MTEWVAPASQEAILGCRSRNLNRRPDRKNLPESVGEKQMLHFVQHDRMAVQHDGMAACVNVVQRLAFGGGNGIVPSWCMWTIGPKPYSSPSRRILYPCKPASIAWSPSFSVLWYPNRRKGSIESDVQPTITKMPQRWDWILTDDSGSFTTAHHTVTQRLHDTLKTWGLQPGDLVVDFSSADPAMAAAMALASRPWTRRSFT